MAFLATSLAGILAADPLSDTRMAALTAALDDHGRALFDGDVHAMVLATPPALRCRMADVAQVPKDELVAAFAGVYAQVPQPDLAGLDMDIRFDFSRASLGVTDLGRQYALLPKQISSASLIFETPVLGLEDDGVWYVVQVDNPMIRAFLVQAYPDLGAVDFSKVKAVVELPQE
jgi:hypothetical protein